MRARRAGTPPRRIERRGSARRLCAAGARRGWQQSYRCLPRAQPGLASRRQTRPDPSLRRSYDGSLVAALELDEDILDAGLLEVGGDLGDGAQRDQMAARKEGDALAALGLVH